MTGTAAFRPATLAAVDIVEVVDRIEDAVETDLFTDAGLSLFGSRGGTGGRLVGVAETPLLTEPVEILRTLPGVFPCVFPERVGVARPPPVEPPRTLMLDAVDAAETLRDRVVPPARVELAVRNVAEPSVVVEPLDIEDIDVNEVDAVEAREVVREDGTDVPPAGGRRLAAGLVPLALLLRIVDA